MIQGTILLFSLNLLDALLTIVWVRNGIAEEGNALMAKLLAMGDMPFLSVKILIGVFAAAVLLKFSNLKMAHYGLTAALIVYCALMGVHLITGLSSFGLFSSNFGDSLSQIAGTLVATYI